MSALLAAGAGDQLEAQSQKGIRPLHCAASYLRPAVVAQLLQLGAQVNARDRQGTCMMAGCMGAFVLYLPGHALGRSPCLLSSLDHFREGKTPLMSAVNGLTLRLVDGIWMKGGLSMTEKREQVQAATASCEAVLDQLLGAGADPNTRVPVDRVSPLLFAAQGSPYGPYCGILRKLLAAGADLYATDAAGRSALDNARRAAMLSSQHRPALQLLEAAAR